MKITKRSLFNPFTEIKDINQYTREADRDVEDIKNAFQRRIRFGDVSNGNSENIAGEYQTVANTGTADTQFTVNHTLGVAPQGFLVVRIDKGGVVYEDTAGTWGSTSIDLKCSAANAAVTLFLLK
jgi:D-mannonate dehydratase